MSMKCKHGKEVIVREETTAWLEWHYLDGKLVSDYANNSFPTGRYEVECQQCGRLAIFHKARKIIPTWARRALELVPEAEQ